MFAVEGGVYVLFPRKGLYGELVDGKWQWWSQHEEPNPEQRREWYQNSIKRGHYVAVDPSKYPPLTLKEEDFHYEY